MAPQSPLEESATTEASRMWHENGRVRWSYCSKNPFIECSFHEITIEFLLELPVVQKAACKKLNKQTDTQTDRQNPAVPEHLRGPVLDSQNADKVGTIYVCALLSAEQNIGNTLTFEITFSENNF